MTINPDIFHDHLDVCAQCREHPFDLCPVGASKLREAATGLPERQPGKRAPDFGLPFMPFDAIFSMLGRPDTEPTVQNIPIRTELGKEIRDAFVKNECPACEAGNVPKEKGLVAAMLGLEGAEAKGVMDFAALEMRILSAISTPPSGGTFVCAACGCETNTSMEKPCVACGEAKVVLLSLVEQLFGKNWRECFK